MTPEPTSDPVATDFACRLQMARAGCRESLGGLLNDLRPYLIKVLEKHDQPHASAYESWRDLVQEACLHAKAGFARFRGGSEPEWRCWVRRILLNGFAEHSRERADRPGPLPDD